MLYIGWGKDEHVDGFYMQSFKCKKFATSHLDSFVRAAGLSDLHIHADRE